MSRSAEDLSGNWADGGDDDDDGVDVRGGAMGLLATSIDASGFDAADSDDDGGDADDRYDDAPKKGADKRAAAVAATTPAVSGGKRKAADATVSAPKAGGKAAAQQQPPAKRQKTNAKATAASAAPAAAAANDGDDGDDDAAPAAAAAAPAASAAGTVDPAEAERKRKKKEKLNALKQKKKLAKAAAAAAGGGAGAAAAGGAAAAASIAAATAAADDAKRATKASAKASKERERMTGLRLLPGAEQATVIGALYGAYVRDQTKALTALEREDAGLSAESADAAADPAFPAAWLVTVPNHTSPVSHELARLPDAVRALMPGWKHALCSKPTAGVVGSPVVLFVTHSTPRSLDIHQSFKRLDKQMRVQKLISKRQKPEEQAQALGSEDVRVVVGTPQRICKLADASALTLNARRLTHVFVDGACDVKGFTLFTIEDVRRDFMALLHKHLYPLLKAGVKLCVF